MVWNEPRFERFPSYYTLLESLPGCQVIQGNGLRFLDFNQCTSEWTEGSLKGNSIRAKNQTKQKITKHRADKLQGGRKWRREVEKQNLLFELSCHGGQLITWQEEELRERLRNPKIPEKACLEQRLKKGTNKRTKKRNIMVFFIIIIIKRKGNQIWPRAPHSYDLVSYSSREQDF